MVSRKSKTEEFNSEDIIGTQLVPKSGLINIKELENEIEIDKKWENLEVFMN